MSINQKHPQGLGQSKLGYSGQYFQEPSVASIRRLIQNVGSTALIVNRLDYYGNSIPTAAFCNAIAFIILGFHRCRVYLSHENDTFLLSIYLFFGGFGQVISGFLEFIKGRAFTASLYLILGGYCISYYYSEYFNLFYSLEFDQFQNSHSGLCAIYGAWMLLTIPLIIASLKTNVFYVIQTVLCFLFFLLMCIGQGYTHRKYGKDGGDTTYVSDWEKINKRSILAGGIFEFIEGLVSFYIFCSQLINEQMMKSVLPCIPLAVDNEIDIPPDFGENHTPQ